MANLNLNQVRQFIQTANFQTLFNELGWDNVNLQKSVVVNNTTLTAIAEKRGFLIFVCEIAELPTVTERKTIAQKIGSLYHEHLIIYFNADKQIWQIAIKELNKTIQYKEIDYQISRAPDLSISKLRGIFFTFDEEENIYLIDVTDRINNSFNSNTEKTTKKFYDHFKKQHAAFMALIHGLENADNQRWYASLMLNRLIFIYFIQKKGFLDEDVNYLRVKLNQIQKAHGDNQFYSFYRHFLLAFFHDGLGKEHKQNKELIKLIGNVPYLNGGLFDVHELESGNADIQIADSALTQLFDFFDQYQWHLDNSAKAKGNEINPDVIGYIFEKYINDRAAMGAYYTKEDISKNTIIPFLFDTVKTECANAFKAKSSLWNLLKNDPNRYIYEAVKKGGDVLDIPEAIAIGIDNAAPNLLERRKAWNSPTPELFGLPTEIWRETIARRQRYFELKTKLENGEITELNDFITHNLNIRQFAQDALEFYDGSDFIKAFFEAIEQITVLDPTCEIKNQSVRADVVRADVVRAGSKPALHERNAVEKESSSSNDRVIVVGAGLEPALTKTTRKESNKNLSEIVRLFKTFFARKINQSRNLTGAPVWHRNYYYIKPKTNGIKISARFAEKLSIKSSNLIFYNPKL